MSRARPIREAIPRHHFGRSPGRSRTCLARLKAARGPGRSRHCLARSRASRPAGWPFAQATSIAPAPSASQSEAAPACLSPPRPSRPWR